MRLLILLLLACVSLSGCFATTQPEPITKYKTIVLAPEDALLVDCDVEPPPGVTDYVKLQDWAQKEGVLIDMSQKQLMNLINCNIRLKNLRAWKAQQLKLYEEKKP